ncbi:hypothetical protein ANN_15463, partial [Periplaneta americana]
LREEQRLRVFENKVLRKIFGAKRYEVTGEWRKLHNAELHALYSSPGIIRNIKSRRLRWAGHVARMDESKNAYRVLVGKPEGKIPLGRPRCRWEDSIKMDLRQVGYDVREGLILYEGGNEPSGSLKAICKKTLYKKTISIREDGDAEFEFRLDVLGTPSPGAYQDPSVSIGFLNAVEATCESDADRTCYIEFKSAELALWYRVCLQISRSRFDFRRAAAFIGLSAAAPAKVQILLTLKYKKVVSNQASSCTPYCDDSVDDEEMGDSLTRQDSVTVRSAERRATKKTSLNKYKSREKQPVSWNEDEIRPTSGIEPWFALLENVYVVKPPDKRDLISREMSNPSEVVNGSNVI